MATIVRVGDRHKAVVRIKGHPTVSKTFSSRIAALRWAEEREHELKHKHIGNILAGKTLKNAFDEYREKVSPRKGGYRWEEVRLRKLALLPMASRQLVSLHSDDLQRWVDTVKLAPGSIRREFTLIRSVLKTARLRWKWMDHDPAKDVELPMEPPSRDRRIDDDEINQVLKALKYEPAAKVRGCAWELGQAFQLALETAMRRGEIWSLDWENVFLDRRVVVLPRTKNGDRRHVPLSLKAVDLLKMMGEKKKGLVFKTRKESAETIWRAKLKAANIKELHFHDTRHEACTRLARKLSVLDLARMIGHRDLNSLMIYYNATAEEIAQQLD